MTKAVHHNRIDEDSKKLSRVPLAVIFDLDDTLFNTSLSMEKLLLPILVKHGINPDALNDARAAEHRKNNGSLDLVQYAIDKGGQKTWDEISAGYVNDGKKIDLLLPDAQAAMDRFKAANVPFGIKTYGNPLLQILKRDASRIGPSVPFHVINHRDKGEMLDAMYNEKLEGFVIEWLGCAASRIVMFENDPTAFRGLEKHIECGRVLAIWIPHSDIDRAKPNPISLVEQKDMASAMAAVSKWSSVPNL